MDKRTAVKGLTEKVEQGDFEGAKRFLTDDFLFVTENPPQEMNYEQWVAFSRLLLNALPDLSYNFTIEEVEDDTVKVRSQMSGTHTGVLDLTSMGGPKVQPTARELSAPAEPSTGYLTEDGLFKRIEIHSEPGSGLNYMMSQMGVPADALA